MTRVIGIVSGKGGVGKTTFSTNLGIALSNLQKKVLLVDCNVTTPHLAYYLGSKYHTATINDVLKGMVDIKYAPTTENGVLFIPASEDMNDLIDVNITKLKHHINKLAEMDDYDFIILDSAPGLGREALATLQASDEIIFVTTPTIPNMSDVIRCAEVAKRIGVKNFKIVLNMVRFTPFEVNYEEVRRMFKLPLLGIIPFDERVIDSAAKGVPIMWDKPNSQVEEGYMTAALSLTGFKFKEVKEPSLMDRIKERFREKFGFLR